MADNTLDRYKARRERQKRQADLQSYGLGQKGERLMDIVLGGAKGTAQQGAGLFFNAMGLGSAFLGAEEEGSNFKQIGDELRQRGYQNFMKGYEKGPEAILKSGEFDPLVGGKLSYLPFLEDEEKMYAQYLGNEAAKKRLAKEKFDPSASANEFSNLNTGENLPLGKNEDFETIFLKIKEREDANRLKKRTLEDEKTNLDAFPKLSIGDAARLERTQLEERRAAEKIDAEAGYEDGGDEAYEKLQDSAIEDIAKSKGEEVTPATREELLAKYKKEFYEATGLDPSGKADKSSALMAMGLALMQNKAGKGFNVGRMLSEVGRAGEKALPKLDAAKKAAKAEALAAGKYALERVTAGESAAAAYAKEMRSYQNAYNLELLKLSEKDKTARREGAKVGDIKNLEVYNGLKLNYGRNDKGSVFAFPPNALNTVGTAMSNLNKAVDTTNKIEILLNNYNKVGGITGNLIVDWAKTGAVSFGLDPARVFSDKMSPQDQINSLSAGIIAQYKKLITQETGNGISNLDVERLQELLANPKMWSNPSKLKSNINEIRQLFLSKLKATNSIAEQLQDKDMYATDAEWNKYKDKALGLTSVDYTTKESSDNAIDVT